MIDYTLFGIGVWTGVMLTLIVLFIIEKITKKDFKLKKKDKLFTEVVGK